MQFGFDAHSSLGLFPPRLADAWLAVIFLSAFQCPPYFTLPWRRNLLATFFLQPLFWDWRRCHSWLSSFLPECSFSGAMASFSALALSQSFSRGPLIFFPCTPPLGNINSPDFSYQHLQLLFRALDFYLYLKFNVA